MPARSTTAMTKHFNNLLMSAKTNTHASKTVSLCPN